MTKRLNGEGHIRQRADGTWEARITVEVGGVRKRVSFYGKTAESVREQMGKGRDRASRQEPIRDSVQRFGDYCEHWITAVRYRDEAREAGLIEEAAQ